VKKGQKDKGITSQDKEDEFNYLKNLIDYNDKYKTRLLDDDDTNRYGNIRCYKDNFVEISSPHKVINASWIHIPYEKSFISAQAPMYNTIDDFWTMCFEYDIKIIIMLCNLEENGKEKCVEYWENKKNNILSVDASILSNFDITYTTEILNEDIIIRNIKITKTLGNEKQTEKNIKQIHYRSWPVHQSLDINKFYGNILFMFNLVDNEIGHNPICVHCSAGVGRTGTFVSMYLLEKEIMKQINDKCDTIRINIFNLVRKIKEMRMYMVQTPIQYLFVYLFVKHLLDTKNI
jgi:protein tyrosine phosphatase